MKNNINAEAEKLKQALTQMARLISVNDMDGKSCCGISFAQCEALVVIGDEGPLYLNDLAQRMRLDKSTLSRTVSSLVEQAFCKREEDPEDRRYVVIGLTAKGTELFRKVKTGMDDYYNRIYSAIPENERTQVLKCVETLIDAIQKTSRCERSDPND